MFTTLLVVDEKELGGVSVRGLSPATEGVTPGTIVTPIGRCLFLDGEERCSIHSVKPWVCARSWHEADPRDVKPLTMWAAESWNAPQHQNQILELLIQAVEVREEPERLGEL